MAKVSTSRGTAKVPTPRGTAEASTSPEVAKRAPTPRELAMDRHLGLIKNLLVRYCEQTKDLSIVKEDSHLQTRYKALVDLLSKDNETNSLLAKSPIISETEKRYRQHFLNRYKLKNEDWASKAQYEILVTSLQLPSPEPVRDPTPVVKTTQR